MSDLCIQDLTRLSHMPDNQNGGPGDRIAGQLWYDVEFGGGNISNVTLTDVIINGVTTQLDQRVFTDAGNTSVFADDSIIIIDKTVPEVTTVEFPASPANGRYIIVKDGGGDAASFNVTLDGNGKNIDGASAYVISTNYGAITLQFNAEEDKWNSIANVTMAGNSVSGPASSTDNAITRWDGTSGTSVQNSSVIIEDDNSIHGIAKIDQNLFVDGGMQVNGTMDLMSNEIANIDTATANIFIGALQGNADTATLASTVTVADAAGDTTTNVLLSGAATGSQAILSDAGLTYNANNNTLTATTFVGALVGKENS